jgi:hypothetical protein
MKILGNYRFLGVLMGGEAPQVKKWGFLKPKA